MKKLLALFLCLFAVSSFGAVYQNQTTSNAVPYISTLKGTNVALFTSTNYGQFTTTNLSGMTNSKVALVDGGVHLPSALFGGSWALPRGTNYYGGQINWWQQNVAFPPPSEGGTSYTSMGTIGVFEQWGGAAVSAISPWMLVTSPNIRLEPGYNAGYGELCLGNEDAANSVYLNWNRGPTLTQYDTANYKGYSMPLSFEADVTDASVNHRKVFPGIIGYAPDYNANADPTSGLRQGELWFQSLTAYRVNGGWAQNGANAFGSNTVFRMRTNMVTFDGTLGVNGTSKTHINGGSITNTDILTKIVGTDSNGKFTGATLSGLTWDGTTLTASGSGTSLFRTNAPAGDGTFTNSNSGGASNVYVGPAYLAITNGPFAINAGKSPATPRVMVSGSGVATYQNTNSFAATNGANYSVMDAAGTFTNSVRVKTPEVQATDVYATRVRAGTPSLPAPGLWGTGSSDSALRLPINGRIVWTIGNNDYDTPSTGAVISNLASGLKLSTNLTVSGSVTATNGFFAYGNGVMTAQNTNSITGTNGSGFFVLDTTGNITNSGNTATTGTNWASKVRTGGAAESGADLVSGNRADFNQIRASGSVFLTIGAEVGIGRVTTGVASIHGPNGTADYLDLRLRNLVATNTVTATNGFISPGTSDLAAIKTGQIQYPTNLTANIAAPDLTKMYGLISTNNNFAITGLSGVNTGASDTNVQVCVRHYRNTSGSVKTITIPVSWTNVIGPQEYTLYFTNVGTLSIERYPGLATNYVFTSN